MRASPLRLNDYFLASLNFNARIGSGQEQAEALDPADLKVEVIEGVNPDNHLQRSCQLRIELTDPAEGKFPWEFSISLVGFFEIAPEWPDAQVNSMFSANAPALLYSAAREALASVSGRGPYPEVLLPSVTFIRVTPPEKKAEPDKPHGTHRAKALPVGKVAKPVRRQSNK